MVEAFAQSHRLRATKDANDDTTIIAGRIDESNIYAYSDTELGVIFITNGRQAPRTQLWNKFSAACTAAGMVPRQVGDAEGSFSFDPSNTKQAKVAIDGIRARVKRVISDEQRAAATARFAEYRQNGKNVEAQ